MITGMTITSIGMPKDMLKSKDALGQKIIKPALQEAVDYWHENFLPRHFRSGAARRYGYRPRRPATLRKKQRKALQGYPNARLPLVMTGQTMRMVSRMIRISGTGKKARGTMSGPRYIHMYSNGGNRPYLAGEITTVTANEARKLSQVLEKNILERIKHNQDKTITRIR